MSEVLDNVRRSPEVTKEGHKMSRYVMGSSPTRSGKMNIKESILGSPSQNNMLSKKSQNGDKSNNDGRNISNSPE